QNQTDAEQRADLDVALGLFTNLLEARQVGCDRLEERFLIALESRLLQNISRFIVLLPFADQGIQTVGGPSFAIAKREGNKTYHGRHSQESDHGDKHWCHYQTHLVS